MIKMISINQKNENRYPFIFNFGQIDILLVFTMVFETNSNMKKLKQISRKTSNPSSEKAEKRKMRICEYELEGNGDIDDDCYISCK